MYKMKSDINFSLTHELLENAENEQLQREERNRHSSRRTYSL